MKISVVIPTITGRENLLDQTMESYRTHTPASVDLEFIIPREASTIGAGWKAGAEAAHGDYLHLSADDVLPHDGWFQAALSACGRMEYPSPRIVNADGSLHSCGTMGGGMLLPECATGTLCNGSPFPFFRAEYTASLVGALPPIHYYADDLLAHRALLLGLAPKVCREYAFTHLEGTVGRAKVAVRAMSDQQTFLDAVAGGTPCE